MGQVFAFESEKYAAMKATRKSDLEHGGLRGAWGAAEWDGCRRSVIGNASSFRPEFPDVVNYYGPTNRRKKLPTTRDDSKVLPAE